MAENNYPLRFNFIANVADFNSKLGQVSGRLKSVSASIGRLGTTLSTRLSLPLAIVGGVAFKMAADFQESLNKVDVSFKKNSKEVKDWSKTTLKVFGISQAQALETAALFGDMGTGMGQTTAAAAKMSIKLSSLSADLASFKNIRQDMAQTALASVYTGETESLKKLGIVMTETNLKEFARQKGIQKTIKDMTQIEKVELRYQFVMDRTKNAQGDFARTSESASNQLRLLKNTMVELGTSIGSMLMPPITKIVKKITQLANGFMILDDSTKAYIITAGLLGISLGPILILLSSIVRFLAFVISPLGLVLIAFTALGATFVYLSNNWDAMKERISDWTWWRNMLIDMVKFLMIDMNPFSQMIDAVNMMLLKLGQMPITNPFKDFAGAFLDKFKKSTKDYETEWGSFSDTIKAEWEKFKPIMDKLAAFFGFTKTGFTSDPIIDDLDPNDTIEETIEKTSSLSDMFQALGGEILPQIGQALTDSFAAIADGENPIRRLWTTLKGLITRLIAAAAAAFILSTIIGGIFGGLGPDKLSGLAAFKNIFGQLTNIKLDKFAKGGIVYGPTLAHVGEYPGARSNPEVIAPLSNLRKLLGGVSGNKNMMVGEFILRGQDLLMAVERAQKNKNRFS